MTWDTVVFSPLQTMRIVAFITEAQVIDRILDHFRRTAAAGIVNLMRLEQR